MASIDRRHLLPIIFTGGQLLPCTQCPTLVAWIRDKEYALRLPSEPGGTPAPVVPRYEEGWLQKPNQEWYERGLLHKLTLTPMPGAPDTTMLILNGPQTNLLGITNYFDAVAAATEKAADGWQASDEEQEKLALRFADITPPLRRRTKALVRWIAAMDHLANA